MALVIKREGSPSPILLGLARSSAILPYIVPAVLIIVLAIILVRP